MMRRLALFLSVLTAALFASSCGGQEAVCRDAVERADLRRLDFWICECVADYDFSDYTEIEGIIGGKEYVNPRYTVHDTCEGQALPEECVVYTLTAWPDYADYGETGYHVTRIRITDPVVMICGLTVKSTREEFDEALGGRGFEIRHENDAVWGGFVERAVSPDGAYDIALTSNDQIKMIVVKAYVSNREGIIFK